MLAVRSMGRSALGEGGDDMSGWLFLFCLRECSSNW